MERVHKTIWPPLRGSSRRLIAASGAKHWHFASSRRCMPWSLSQALHRMYPGFSHLMMSHAKTPVDPAREKARGGGLLETPSKQSVEEECPKTRVL